MALFEIERENMSALSALSALSAALLSASGLLALLAGFALIFGASKGYRGTASGAGTGPALTYFANMGGVVLSMASILMFAWGACVHLLRLPLPG